LSNNALTFFAAGDDLRKYGQNGGFNFAFYSD